MIVVSGQADPTAPNAPAEPLTPVHRRWLLSPAVTAGVIVAVACLGVGFVTARIDLALVGVPLVVAAAWAWDRRPGETVGVDVSTTATTDGADATAEVRVAATTRADAVELRLALRGQAPQHAFVSVAAARRIAGRVRLAHSGPQQLVAAEVRILGADASIVSDPTPPSVASRVVRPRVVPVRSLPLPARLIGLTGQHGSARAGDGGEFRDVDRFTAGDRLRRIDWKATARRGQSPGDLFVRRTMATSDAAVQFVFDSRDDLTGRVADWAAQYPELGVGSQDLAREAAVSLATAYSAAGDRVGFDDLASVARQIPPRAGGRHLQRVLRAVSLTGPNGAAGDRVRAPVLAPGALVYVLSTFLDEQALRLALVWRAAGHRVIAVDVLPTVDDGGLSTRERSALRVVLLERELRFRRLTAAGVDRLRWQTGGGEHRDTALRVLSRPRRPR
ncbi:DUF58 domain-containing protein [Leifsonia sp. NPDC058292]|uniref:DUF58 domain-containing protein n=1 Tax=Leifsonia sp. NPDC058292 TaxID=3346428 RepID=UPI0036D9D081